MNKEVHVRNLEQLQKEMKALLKNDISRCIALKYRTNSSFTLRTKTYKDQCLELEFGALNQVVEIDPVRKVAIVEPRMTMEELVKTTLRYGLSPPVVPELRKITVGGAIMGVGAESASHRFGCFHDTCLSYEMLLGDGSIVKASSTENADLFYAVPGSYGSLGPLLSCEISLVEAKNIVRLSYISFKNPLDAIDYLKKKSLELESPFFLDGIVFSKELAVVIEGSFDAKNNVIPNLKTYSPDAVGAELFYQHAKEIALNNPSQVYQELMSLEDYFFRYDRGAFWMGAYLFNPSFFACYIREVLLGMSKDKQVCFNEVEVKKFKIPEKHHFLSRYLMHPLMSSNLLNKMLSFSDAWIQNRFIVQDFCIPIKKASQFLSDVMDNPSIFPLWLLPIKGEKTPQIFAPHYIKDEHQEDLFINVGTYGLPSYSESIAKITKGLEQKTSDYGGRKVLYNYSYYTPDEFWKIYSYDRYMDIRTKYFANGFFHEITDKVLSKGPK